MPSIDMPLEKLREYAPPLYREPDFESYWRTTIADAIRQPINAELIPYDLHARGVQCYAVRFDGFCGGRIAGWYLRPDLPGKLPGICFYHGYSGRGQRPLDMLIYAQQGICCLSMDCRGQNGQSQNLISCPEGAAAGWMTMGIRDPQSYYYRYVYADTVRAIELLARREEVDEDRIAITGASQGGALTLAAAALSDRPILAMPDIPFLCDFRRAIQITPAGPYPEIPSLLKAFPDLVEPALRTLSYCDNLNLAPWIKCRTIISNCLWDDICPPSTIFAVYNHLACEKQMEIYPFHKHEVPYEQSELRFRLLTETLVSGGGAAKVGA
jgi:cephalosporin-C deacetylase